MSELKYRPDVDGLRAVAVILVLLFHGGLGFTGGYVGVDVFFVISGYLITGLILKQQRSGTFRLADFWGRRIRRIVPASSAVALFTLIAGSVLLLPSDYEELAESTLAQQLMLSNVFFWRHTGYFAGPGDLKPLLHTWSLAVEEQFYLAYPFLLVLLNGARRGTVAGVLAIVALASLGVSEWGVHNYPGAAFYLLPTRAWELLLGGLLCFAPAPSRRGRYYAQVLSAAGLVMILWAALLFDSSTRFPGFSALLPCIGAALLIYANSGRLTLVGRLLALKPVVLVGLISYSLYLWHWPILAFSRYWLGQNLATATVWTALAASFALSYASWRLVETPFRANRSAASRKRALPILCATLPMLILCSLVVIGGRGFPGRVPKAAIGYDRAQASRAFSNEVTGQQVRSRQMPTFGAEKGPLTCIVWGDSKAMALMPGIDLAAKSKGVRGFQATHSATPPLLDFTFLFKWGLSEQGPAFNRAVVDFAIASDVDVVIMAGAWSTYALLPSFERQLQETVTELHRAGITVAIVLDVAEQDEDVPRALARRAFFGLPVSDFGVSLSHHRARNRRCHSIIDRVASGRARVLDPTRYFVDARGLWRAEIEDKAMYRDKTHLTVEGSLRLRGLFEDLFDSIESAASERPTANETAGRPAVSP